jgi:hypothetical protein
MNLFHSVGRGVNNPMMTISKKSNIMKNKWKLQMKKRHKKKDTILEI